MTSWCEVYWPTKRCLKCDYDLRGSNESGQCPECGREFDISTVIVEAWRYKDWPRWWNIPFFVGAILNSLMLVFIALVAPFRVTWVRWVLAGAAIFVLYNVVRKSHDLVLRRKGQTRYRLVLWRKSVGLLTVGNPIVVRFDWRDISQLKVRRLRDGVWRFMFLISGFKMIDVVITGAPRAVAALRREIRSRMRTI